MSDPSLELQGALVARLKTAAAVTAIVGQAIYDAVPGSDPFPRITIGAVQIIPDRAQEYAATGTIPVMLDPAGKPVQRNFVHVQDLVDSILAALDHPAAVQQTFNICMDEPVDYRRVAEYLAQTRGLPSVDLATPYHSTWLDNAKAKFLLKEMLYQGRLAL